MMDRTYIDANHIIDRYLAGQLSESEAREFECYYLEHPAMLDELHTQQALREALASEADQLQPEAIKTDPPPISLVDRITHWLTPKPLLALSGLLTVGVATLLVQNAQLRRSEVAAFASYDTVLLQQVRGVDTAVASHPINFEKPMLKLSIELGPLDIETVDVSIYGIDDRLLWSGTNTFDRTTGIIDIMLNSEQVGAGQYQIEVSQPGQTEPAVSIASYRLNLTLPKP